MGRKCLVASEVSLRGHRCCRAVDHPQDVVERITLRWSLSRGSDQVEDLVETQALSSVGSCLVIDLLPHDRAFEVVTPNANDVCDRNGVTMIQCVLMWSKLSRKSRPTARLRKSSKPVVAVPSLPSSLPSSL